MLKVRSFKPELIPNPYQGDKFSYDESKPLDVEIGCGVGLHPIQYSQRNPERTIVAIEHTKEKFNKFLSRYNGHDKPNNLIPVHANAISWITHKLKKEQVDRFFFLYPNPNPKSSDLSKRWHAMPFMEQVIKCLKVGGEITLATNEEFYYQEAKEYFSKVWQLELVTDECSPFSFVGRTHFERKYLERGQTCFNLVFKKL